MREVLFAGFGGQGVLTAGLILSQIALYGGHNATWMPSYGATMRGGTANCVVKFGAEMIYCPAQEAPDLLVAMNGPSLEKFVPALAPHGYVLYNSDIISEAELGERRTDVTYIPVPCMSIATEVHNPRGANIVMVGQLLKLFQEFDRQVCLDGMNDMFRKKGKEKFEAGNTAAFNAGYAYTA